MKYLAIVALVLGSAVAQKFSATRSGDEIVITRSESENNGDGTFKWVSELSDGTKLSQNGYIKPGPDPENPIQVIQGAFSYTAPDGTPIALTYTADENGFVPVADHLPTPPPIPAEIQKGLDIIYANLDKAASQVSQVYRPAPQQAPISRGLQQPRRF